MPRMTMAEVNAFNARQVANYATNNPEGVEVESDLHEQIFSECRRRGWIALHGSMSERTSRTLGEPDFTILADAGRVLFVECKSRKGKLSTIQQAMAAHAKKLGHTIHEVRSLEEFLTVTQSPSNG
jgi:Holliday junction resolvase-like predicted endonuclease